MLFFHDLFVCLQGCELQAILVNDSRLSVNFDSKQLRLLQLLVPAIPCDEIMGVVCVDHNHELARREHLRHLGWSNGEAVWWFHRFNYGAKLLEDDALSFGGPNQL